MQLLVPMVINILLKNNPHVATRCVGVDVAARLSRNLQVTTVHR